MNPSDLFLANRRDALLVLLLQTVVLGGAWEQGALGALGGSLATAGLFLLLLMLFRQSALVSAVLFQPPGDMEPPPWERVLASAQWGLILLALGTLPTMLLVARAAWQGLGSPPIVMLLALLTLGWQVWLSFWTAELPPPPHKEE